jgi:hypothetical protein
MMSMGTRWIGAMATIAWMITTGVAAAQPAEVLAMRNLPGGGDLFIGYCLAGEHLCVERKAFAYGQTCDSGLARDMGNGESGEVDGWVPPLFHYAGFRCGEGG